jgi:hypothetical protein
MAIVDGAVSGMEVAGAVKQIAELRACEAVLLPIDLGRAASPGLVLEGRPVSFGELSVEAAVVRDHDGRVFDECRHLRVVDAVAGDHLVGDARKRHDFVGDRSGRLVEGRERVPHAATRPSAR